MSETTTTSPQAQPHERSRTGEELPLVRAVNVMKSFHGTEVLKGIDLVVQPGQVMVLLGPSVPMPVSDVLLDAQ